MTRSFILGNSGESKSYNDDDEHSGVWNTSTSTRTTYHTCRHRRPSSRRKGKEEVGIRIPPSLISSPRLLIRLVAFRIHLKLIVPAFLSHISPSRSRQLWPSRSVIPRLCVEMVIPVFRLFGSSAWVVVVGIMRIKQISVFHISVLSASLTWGSDICWVLCYRRVGDEPSFILSPLAVVVSSFQPTEH